MFYTRTPMCPYFHPISPRVFEGRFDMSSCYSPFKMRIACSDVDPTVDAAGLGSVSGGLSSMYFRNVA